MMLDMAVDERAASHVRSFGTEANEWGFPSLTSVPRKKQYHVCVLPTSLNCVTFTNVTQQQFPENSIGQINPSSKFTAGSKCPLPNQKPYPPPPALTCRASCHHFRTTHAKKRREDKRSRKPSELPEPKKRRHENVPCRVPPEALPVSRNSVRYIPFHNTVRPLPLLCNRNCRPPGICRAVL